MPSKYKYVARSKQGEKITGTLEAGDSSVVAKTLKEQGYYIISINEDVQKKDIREYIKIPSRVTFKDLSVFSQQFASMIEAGISLVNALEIMEEQTDHSRLKEGLSQVREDVETGRSLGEAMAKHSKVFPDLYIQLIKAGEEGGVIGQVLNDLAAHYEKQDKLVGMIKSTLYYPITIVFVAVTVVVFLMAVVVPTFVAMFSGLGAQLPLPTRVLIGISSFMRVYWWLIFLGFLISVFLIIRFLRTTAGKVVFDRLLLRIPIIGKLLKKIYLSRFSSTLAMLLESGVDLLTSLKMVEDVIGNRVYANFITKVRSEVREGIVLSRPLEESKLFPPMVVQMINVGEETGSIEKMLDKISSFYDNEVENSVESVISMIEPIIIISLAGIVGFIVLSIILPMFEMLQHF